jgi:hypothetical protein
MEVDVEHPFFQCVLVARLGLAKKRPSAQQTAETMHRLRLGHPEDGMREYMALWHQPKFHMHRFKGKTLH